MSHSLLFPFVPFFHSCFSSCYLALCWQIRNEKARRYLSNMRKKPPVPFPQKFPNVDPLALRLLEGLLAFDPKDRPTAEEVLRFSSFVTLISNSN